MSYNPNPTRVWSRVQNQCTYIDSSNNAAYQNVYVPLTGKTMSLFEANYQDKLISKGNILQYKKNSSNLTKKQKYTQICKGMWTNRTKSYATQSQTYTNPNTSNLLQVNYNVVPSTGTTYINGPYKYNIPSPYGCVSTIIKDGGSLLCNTIANPCTNEIIETTKVLKCYPTTCSDVPGPEQLLCWDSKLDTWYPRQRYIMPTSGTSWPEGYKGFVSAEKPPTPVLTLDDTSSCNSVTLSWTVTNDDCIPISSYNIYLNGQIYTTVSYTTTTITISNLSNGNYSFNVTSISNTTESDKSNTINISQIWSPLGTGINNGFNLACNTIAFDPDGNLYAGGNFTTAGGNPANYIAKWNGTTWSPLGTGLSNSCKSIAFGPDGNLYAGGNFITAGGVSVNYIAKWDGTWYAFGSGLNSVCRTIAFAPDGSLYAGGVFTSLGNHIVKWNGTAWSPLGSGLGNSCFAIAFGLDGSLYAGGNFTTAGGNPANRIAKWNINTNTWSALGSGLNASCSAIACGSDGNLYAGGDFTTAGGLLVNYIAKWNVTTNTWSSLGSGLNVSCYAIAFDPNGNLYAGGDFTTAGGVSTICIAKWNVTTNTWSALGSGLNDFCYTIALNNCDLYAGGDFTTAGGVSANRIASYKTIYT